MAEPLDEHIDPVFDFNVTHVAGDGLCLYHAIYTALLGSGCLVDPKKLFCYMVESNDFYVANYSMVTGTDVVGRDRHTGQLKNEDWELGKQTNWFGGESMGVLCNYLGVNIALHYMGMNSNICILNERYDPIYPTIHLLAAGTGVHGRHYSPLFPLPGRQFYVDGQTMTGRVLISGTKAEEHRPRVICRVNSFNQPDPEEYQVLWNGYTSTFANKRVLLRNWELVAVTEEIPMPKKSSLSFTLEGYGKAFDNTIKLSGQKDKWDEASAYKEVSAINPDVKILKPHSQTLPTTIADYECSSGHEEPMFIGRSEEIFSDDHGFEPHDSISNEDDIEEGSDIGTVNRPEKIRWADIDSSGGTEIASETVAEPHKDGDPDLEIEYQVDLVSPPESISSVQVNQNMADLLPKEKMDIHYNTVVNDVSDRITIVTKRQGFFTQIFATSDLDLDSNSCFASSVYKSQMKYPILSIHDDDLHKLPHEMVALCFSSDKTDVPLKDDLPEDKVNSRFAKMTPDIRISQGTYLEIATNFIGTESKLLESYRSKQATYETAFEELEVMDRFKLFVIVVSRRAVLCDFEMDDRETTFVSSMYRLGLRTLSKIKEDYGIAVKQKESGDCTLLKASMDKCPPLSDGTLPHVGQSQLDMWRDYYTNRNVDPNSICKQIIYDAFEAFKVDKVKQVGQACCRDYCDRVEKIGSRSDTKAIIQFNCVAMVEPKLEPLRYPVIDLTDDSHPMVCFASKALDAMVSNVESWHQHQGSSYEEIQKISLDDLRWKTMKHASRNLVKIELNDIERFYLAKKGVQAKMYKFDPLLDVKRKKNKQPFSLRKTDTTDIQCFVDNLEIHKCQQQVYLPETEIYMNQLINDASTIANGRSESFSQKCIDNFRRTALGQLLFVSQLIVEEVNLDLKVNSRKDEFVVKRLPDQDTYLVIKPTRSDSHIFFCIVTTIDPLCTLPFKTEWYKSGDWNISSFVSLDRLRISNLLGCFERVCLIRHMLLETWGCSMQVLSGEEPIDDLDRMARDDCFKTTNFLVLTMFADNTSVTDMLQNVRYAYMEVCSSKIGVVDPLKIVKKFPLPRNRLCVFIYRKFVESFSKMTVRRPQYNLVEKEPTYDPEETSPSRDTFCNLINWLTGSEIFRFEQAIELSYLGVLHNKDEGDIAQGQFQILNKIIGQEIEMRYARPERMGNVGGQPLSDIRTHEFDANFVLAAGELLANDAKDQFSNSRNSYVEEKLRSMRKKRIEEFATFKSSARKLYDSTWSHGMTHDPRTKTIKAIMEILDSSGDGVSPYVFDHISELLEATQSSPMVVDMFKKNQLTGIREIFILWIVDRITIFFMEEFFYNIADDVDSEMISEGKGKYSRGLSFRSIVSRASSDKEYKVQNCDSSDAATWCQRFVMSIVPCFLTPLLHDTNPSLLRCITTICNNITNKKLLIPSDMLQKFFTKVDVRSTDDGLNELKDQFLGVSPNDDLLKKGHTTFNNRSNFMQGICGVTFSVIHAYALKLEDKAERMLASMLYGGLDDKVKFITLDQVSSDDKGKQRCLLFNGELPHKPELFLTICSKMAEVMMPRFGAMNSREKSTNGSFSEIYEFNSFWSIRGTYTLPKIKFCSTTMDPKISMDIEGRRSKWANLAKQLPECGCSLLTADVCQRLQARVNYYCMGMSCNPYFIDYCRELRKTPHTTFGFFTLEPENCCGILGSNFAKYVLLRRNSRSRCIEQAIASRSECVISKGGEVTLRINATPINMDRFFKFKATLGDSHATERVFQDDPALLFRQAENRTELKAKIMLKTRDPETAQSFSFECSQKVYVMGLFMISHPCIAMRTSTVKKKETKVQRIDRNRPFRFLDFLTGRATDEPKSLNVGVNESGTETSSKCTLAYMMKILRDSDQELSDESMRLMFPLNSVYDYCMDELPKIDYESYARTIRENSRYITSTNLERDVAVRRVSMLEACSYKWFGNDSKYSKSILESAFSKYKSEVAFIKNSFDETLDSSPFESPVDLYSFLLSLQENRVTLTVLAPVKKMPIKVYLSKLTERSWCRFHVRQSTIRKLTHASELEMAGRILSSPMQNEDKERLLRNMYMKSGMLSSRLSDAINEVNSIPLSAQIFTIALDTLFHNDPGRFLELLCATNKGHFGFYSTPQVYDKDKMCWLGSGTYCYQIGKYTSYLNLQDDTVTSILTNAPDSANRMLKNLHKFIRMNQWKSDSTSGRRLTTEGVTVRSGPSGVPIRTGMDIQPVDVGKMGLDVSCTRSGLLKVRSASKTDGGYRPTFLNSTAPSFAAGKEEMDPKLNFLFENMSPEVKSWLSSKPHSLPMLTASVGKLMKLQDSDPTFGTHDYQGDNERLSKMMEWCCWSMKNRMSTITNMPSGNIKGGHDERWEVNPVDKDYEDMEDYGDFESSDESEVGEYDDNASTPSFLKGIDDNPFNFEFDEDLGLEQAMLDVGTNLEELAENAGIVDFDLGDYEMNDMVGRLEYTQTAEYSDDQLSHTIRNTASALNEFWDRFLEQASKEDLSLGRLIMSKYKPSDAQIESLPTALKFVVRNMNMSSRLDVPIVVDTPEVEIPEDSLFA